MSVSIDKNTNKRNEWHQATKPLKYNHKKVKSLILCAAVIAITGVSWRGGAEKKFYEEKG
jgi:hypothetical protein